MIKVGMGWFSPTEIGSVNILPKDRYAGDRVVVTDKKGMSLMQEFASLEEATAFAEEIVAKINQS